MPRKPAKAESSPNRVERLGFRLDEDTKDLIERAAHLSRRKVSDFCVTALVEKPDAADAPSNLAIIGRYLLDPAVFRVLEHTAPGRGGEIQLTDALATLASMPAEQGGGVTGVVFRGRRYDTGDRLDYLKAVVRIAVDRPDLGPDLRSWLREFVTTL